MSIKLKITEKMREILFRGKSIHQHGKWVYGDLIHDPECENPQMGHVVNLSGDGISEPPSNSYIKVEVDPETVGQFTGLLDKNYVKIFEGDIVKIQIPLGGFWGNVKQEKIGVVEYESEYGAWNVRWEYSKNQHHIILNCDIACESEVFGNIHDNPELLTPCQ